MRVGRNAYTTVGASGDAAARFELDCESWIRIETKGELAARTETCSG